MLKFESNRPMRDWAMTLASRKSFVGEPCILLSLMQWLRSLLSLIMVLKPIRLLNAWLISMELRKIRPHIIAGECRLKTLQLKPTGGNFEGDLLNIGWILSINWRHVVLVHWINSAEHDSCTCEAFWNRWFIIWIIICTLRSRFRCPMTSLILLLISGVCGLFLCP